MVGTHHKVLTVFMTRIFRDFAQATRRTISVGMADDVDYSADILFDHHSQFDFSKLGNKYIGIHFRRNPRDLLISAGFYHKRSKEPQLHIPSDEFGGQTYQQFVNDLPSMEEVFLFELEHSAGMNINQMQNWDYNRGFLELKYEDLVTPRGGKVFRQAISSWPLSALEKTLLEGLFNYYSIFGTGGANNRHIRDSRSCQFREHFGDKVQQAFDTRFANVTNKLGYE